MSSLIAVEGCSFGLSCPEADGSVSGGSVSVTSAPSEGIFVDGHGAYFGAMSVEVSGLSYYPAVPPEGAVLPGTQAVPVTARISGSGSGVAELPAEDSAVLEGDSGTVSVTFVFETTVSPYTATASTDVTVKVTEAGQDCAEAS